MMKTQLHGLGNFSAIYDETYNVKTLNFTDVNEDTDKLSTTAFYDLANQITKGSKDMTLVAMQ